jgi:transcriptional regulator with XRE-family HTH domain
MEVDANEAWVKYAASLGTALARARTTRGLSQEDVAYAAGIAAYSYRKLEKGESNPGTPGNPRLRTLVAIAGVLGVPVAALLPPDPEGVTAWN